ncbi:MAG TPA: hypothetical protein VK689_08140 [Armatimonadota bacterium]|nr:hypothetical protein [Armatimonadota bacterium]
MANVRKEHGCPLSPPVIVMHRTVVAGAVVGAVAPSAASPAASPDFW